MGLLVLALLLVGAHAQRMTLPGWHPNVHDALRNRQRAPTSHPSIHPTVSTWPGFDRDKHTNPVDNWLLNPSSRYDVADHNWNSWIAYDSIPSPLWVVPDWHPDVVTLYADGTPLPTGHPDLGAGMNLAMQSHPNLGTMLATAPFPALPVWHVNINNFVEYRVFPKPLWTIPGWHPSLESLFDLGVPMPQGHPAVHATLAAQLNHPNIDTMLSSISGFPALPSWHPALNEYIAYTPAIPSPLWTVPDWHPDIEAAVTAGTPLPVGHPDVQGPLTTHFPAHPAVSASAGPMPVWHVDLNVYIEYVSIGHLWEVPAWHPDLDALWTAGVILPPIHPTVNGVLAAVVPTHTDLDILLSSSYDPTVLPDWHSTLEDNVLRQAPDIIWNIVGNHKSIQSLVKAGTPLPPDHPPIHAALQALLPNHPNIETAMAIPAYAFPVWHSDIDQFAEYTSIGNLWQLPGWHPDVGTLLEEGYSLPANHTSINPALSAVFPAHVNVDTFLQQSPLPALPSFHPDINDTVSYGPFPDTLWTIPFWHPAIDSLVREGHALPANHPDVNSVLMAEMPSHPNINTHLAVEGYSAMPPWHANLDDFVLSTDADGLAVSLWTVPGWHPDVEEMFAAGELIPLRHPPIDQPLVDAMPSHTGVLALFSSWPFKALPSFHPKINDWILYLPSNAEFLAYIPSWHINIEANYRLGRNGDRLPEAHPKFQDVFAPVMPASHPNIDELMRDGSVLMPLWHPPINEWVGRRSPWTAGVFMACIWAILFLLAVAIRYIYKVTKCLPKLVWGKSRIQLDKVRFQLSKSEALQLESFNTDGSLRDDVELGDDGSFEFCEMKAADGRRSTFCCEPNAKDDLAWEPKSVSLNPPTVSSLEGKIRKLPPLPPPPRRDMRLNASAALHAQHVAKEPIYSFEGAENLEAAPDTTITSKLLAESLGPKQQTCAHSVWFAIKSKRIPGTEWTMGNVVFCTTYVLVNVICVFLSGPATSIDDPEFSPEGFGLRGVPDIGRAFGSLAICNGMLLVIPATRNSVVTWGLGLPFDHVIVYHRFMGRVALLCVLAHFLFYVEAFVEQPDRFKLWSGVLAGFCGLLIGLTTFNCVRRKHFNVFYYTHYSFIGFFALSYMHVPDCQPFVLMAASLYCLDRLLRVLWMLVPRRTRLFRSKSDGTIAQVRFPKNPITHFAGMHKVGQYYFVNFPGLSLTEWHPFSVSCSPREETVELHIRALGDHTKEINKYAIECEKINKQPWIRMDGPYGVHDFNLRRYPVLVLVGGGVGITPVIGIVKDIFNCGEFSTKEKKNVIPHAIETVYCVWVMPNQSEAPAFMNELKSCMHNSNLPQMPNLVVWIYCTRAKEKLEPPLMTGRPKFPEIFEQMEHNHPGKPSFVFACGPGVMVAQLWDLSVKRTAKGQRVDFHHETFEF